MRPILFSAFLLTGAMLFSAYLINSNDGNSAKAIVGTWELVSDYDIDSVFDGDSLFAVNRSDTTYTHGKSFSFSFKSNNTSVLTDNRANPDNLSGIPRIFTSTYALLPGKIVLPNQGDFGDTFNYTIVKNVLTLDQSGWKQIGTVAFAKPRKSHRGHILEKQ